MDTHRSCHTWRLHGRRAAYRSLAASLTEKGHCINWDCADDANWLLRCLYNKLVKYQNKTLRLALRLDHAPAGTEGDNHPVADRLAAHDGYDPLKILLAAESNHNDAKLVDYSHGLATAYVRLTRHFRNDMHAMAQYLLVSRSWAYRCLQKTRILTERQLPIAFSPSRRKLPFPRPWRTFRLQRMPKQLVLDFTGDSLPIIQSMTKNTESAAT